MRRFVLLLVLVPVFAQAQDTTILVVPNESDLEPLSAIMPRALCFRGRPIPECQAFFITEAQAGYRILKSGPDGDLHGFVLGGDIGWMRNLDDRNAVGGVIGANNLYVSLGPRYRRWLTDKTALDIGLSAAWEPGRIEIVELHVAMMRGDRIGLWANATHDFGRGEPGLAAGVQVGAEPGLIAFTLGAAIAVIYVIRVRSFAD